MTRPLVTIVITVFKRTDYLEEAIKSALGQSFTDVEVIVTDDADSESARAVCAAFGPDPRLRYRSNPTTLGAPMNIAAALREARGMYISVLNDDDMMEPSMVEKLLLPLLRDPKCVLSFADHWMVDGAGEQLTELTSWNSTVRGRTHLPRGFVEEPFDFALRGGVLIVMGALFRRRPLDPSWLVPQVRGAYDYWLAVRLSRTGGSFHYLPERVMRYRVHSASESGRFDPEKNQGEIYIYESLLKEEIEAQHREYVTERLADFLFILGRDRLYSGNRDGARAAFIRSLHTKLRTKAAVGVLSTYLPYSVRQAGVRALRALRAATRAPAELGR